MGIFDEDGRFNLRIQALSKTMNAAEQKVALEDVVLTHFSDRFTAVKVSFTTILESCP